MEYYIYQHIRLDSCTPFYVGKGKGRRFKSSSGRNRYWHNIVKSVGYKSEIVIEGLSEQEALDKEAEIIKQNKELGYCEANIALGGSSNSGFHHSEDTKKLISEESKSNPAIRSSQFKRGCVPWNKGKSRTPTRAKPVIDQSTGQVYASCKEAAQKLNITYSTFRAWLGGQNPNKSNFKYL